MSEVEGPGVSAPRLSMDCAKVDGAGATFLGAYAADHDENSRPRPEVAVRTRGMPNL